MQAGNVHVSPDCFDSTWADIPLRTLLSWALTPASDDVMWQLHKKGRADAAAWARLTGVGDAAAPDVDDWYRCASTPPPPPLTKDMPKSVLFDMLCHMAK